MAENRLKEPWTHRRRAKNLGVSGETVTQTEISVSGG
jgi:hypothetical protein